MDTSRAAATLPQALRAAVAVLLALACVLVLAPARPAAAQTAADVQRLAGPDRVATAVAVARSVFPDGAPAAVVVRADDYPDALAGGPLAAALDGPVLLTDGSGLSPAVAEELTRLGADEVVLLGGTGALAPAVEDAVRGLGIAQVSRIAGPDRFATAALAAGAVLDRTGASSAYVALGASPSPTGGWPDALAVSALAASQGRPVLLTAAAAVPAATGALVRDRGLADLTLVGGTAVVPETVVDGLRGAGAQVRRVAGADRYATSLAVADLALAEGVTPTEIWLATGATHADALGAGAAVAARGGLLVLVDGARWADLPARAWLAARGGAAVRIVGGPGAVPATVETDLRGAAPAAPAPAAPEAPAIPDAADLPPAGPAAPAGPAPVAPTDPAQTGGAPVSSPTLPDVGMPIGTEGAAAPEAAPADQAAATGETAPEADAAAAEPVQVQGAAPAPEARQATVAGVRLAVGANFQRAVDANPPGTTFIVAAGVHRMQSVRPKDGDRFIGESGAIMSGSRVLAPSQFRRDGAVWAIGGQTQQVYRREPMMLPGREAEGNPEELFSNGRRMRPVSSRAELTRYGTWYLDYATDTLYVRDDPATLGLLEATVTEAAFAGPGTRDVVIENLAVRHYSSPAQRGAVNAIDTISWRITRVDASWNHGAGISMGPGTRVSYCRMTYNGQLGLQGRGQDTRTGYTAPGVVEHSEMARNYNLGFQWGWEAGAMKLTKYRDGVMFVNNWVHSNRGPGIWFDIDNANVTIRSNLVENNERLGIFYEISYGPTRIYWNIVRNNNKVTTDESAGIYISNSRDVEVFGNAVYGHRLAIRARQNSRGTGMDGLYEIAGLNVHHNDLSYSVWSGLQIEWGGDIYYTAAKRNSFSANTYRTAHARPFWWNFRSNDRSAWLATGQDAGARFLDPATTPQLPTGATGWVKTRYGAR